MTRINQIIGFSEIVGDQLADSGDGAGVDDLKKVTRAAKELQGMIDANLQAFATAKPVEEIDVASFDVERKLSAVSAHEGESSETEALKGHFLVADDNELNRDMLGRRLQRQGYTVSMACDGKEAVELLAKEEFNIVLLDVMMPEMNGYEVLSYMKEDEKFRHIPVIMISALTEMDSVTHCIEKGAEDYLPKPFDVTLLKARIHSCLERKQLRDKEQATYRALLASQQELADELNEAAAHVRNLLPAPIDEGDKPPRMDWRYIPSVQLGGDAFGYEWLDPDHFAIYVLDVCGHGVRAALLSISAMNVLRSKSLPDTDFRDPSSVLERLNDAFPMEKQDEMYFTIWYGVYRPSDRKLVYSSGGHPAAELVHADGGELKSTGLKTPGMVIGGMPDMSYRLGECEAPEGSTLFVFSDGVFEIEKPDGAMMESEEFTEQVLAACREAPGEELGYLLDAARELNGEGSFEDDYSILRVQF